MNSQHRCGSYRTNWEIFKTLIWLNLWLLKVLVVVSQLVHSISGTF